MVLGQIDTIPAEREVLDDVSNGQKKSFARHPERIVGGGVSSIIFVEIFVMSRCM